MPISADKILSEKDKGRLDEIVIKMVSNKEKDEDIQLVVDDFKDKYGVKKKNRLLHPLAYLWDLWRKIF